MKQELLGLINQTDFIRRLAHSQNDYIPHDFVLYDVDEFIKWKQKIKSELIAIPNKDQYIEDTIKLVNVRYDGLNDKRNFMELSASLEAVRDNVGRYYAEDSSIGSTDKQSNNKVFIVHGHDEAVRDRVELFLRRVGLDPVILCNKPNGGLTIIEKIEEYTDVAFALVLYTGCDEGKLKTDVELKPRARQNVVVEHGYLIQKLGRERVVALVEDGVETPGDVSGVLYISLSDTDWERQALRELVNCGLNVGTTNI